jgi:hypothetical protein
MLMRIIKHKYFFHIAVIVIILAVTVLFIIFSGTSN